VHSSSLFLSFSTKQTTDCNFPLPSNEDCLFSLVAPNVSHCHPGQARPPSSWLCWSNVFSLVHSIILLPNTSHVPQLTSSLTLSPNLCLSDDLRIPWDGHGVRDMFWWTVLPCVSTPLSTLTSSCLQGTSRVPSSEACHTSEPPWVHLWPHHPPHSHV
jgi:hypothetical protein